MVASRMMQGAAVTVLTCAMAACGADATPLDPFASRTDPPTISTSSTTPRNPDTPEEAPSDRGEYNYFGVLHELWRIQAVDYQTRWCEELDHLGTRNTAVSLLIAWKRDYSGDVAEAARQGGFEFDWYGPDAIDELTAYLPDACDGLQERTSEGQ